MSQNGEVLEFRDENAQSEKVSVVTKPEHKSYLYRLFLTDSPTGLVERSFPLAQLMQAASVARKLRENSSEIANEDGSVTGIRFIASPTEFMPDEARLLRDLISSTVREATLSEYGLLLELQDILAP